MLQWFLDLLVLILVLWIIHPLRLLTADAFATVSSLLDSIGVSCDGIFVITKSIERLSTHLTSSTETTIVDLVTYVYPMIEVSADVLDTVEDVVEQIYPYS